MHFRLRRLRKGRDIMRRKLIILMLVVLFAAVLPDGVYADSPSSAALPRLEDLFDGQNNDTYLQYRENYKLDLKEPGMFSFSEQAGSMANSFANVLFYLQVECGYLLITIFYYAFELDIYGMLSGVMETFVAQMKTSLFDELSLLAIVFLGIYFVIKVVQDQKTQVWVAILQTAIIVAIAMYFFTSPTEMLQQVDKGSKAISTSVLTGTYKSVNNGASPDSAVMAACNNIWYIYVHQPWQMLEFGNIEMAKREEQNILKYSPDSEERQEYIEKLSEDEVHFTFGWGWSRIGLILLYLIPILVMFAVIVVLSLLMLAYQVLTLLFTLLGVFVFILALVPFFGMRLIQNWLSKVLGFAFIKVIVCFALGVMLAFISSIFSISDQYGWLLTVILEVMVVVTIFWKRNELVELFTIIRLAPQNPSMINRQIRRDANVEGKINDFMGARLTGFRDRKSLKDRESNAEMPAKQNKADKKLSKAIPENSDGKTEKVKPDGTVDSEKTGAIKSRNAVGNGKTEKTRSAGAGDKGKTDKAGAAGAVDMDKADKAGSGGTIGKGKTEKIEAGVKSVKAAHPSSERKQTGVPAGQDYNRVFSEMSQDQSEDNNNFRQLMKKAEEILQKQYEISKLESENKAEKLNKEPEYSSFVQKVDTREALGAPKFDQREIIATAQNIKRISASGGRPEELLRRDGKGEVQNKQDRPRDVISLVVNGQQQSLDRNEAYKIIVQEASKEYSQEFNQAYGKRYDDKFFDGLIKRYGQQNVRQIMNRMKEIKEKEGNIKNPAGYLTQSLKNQIKENSVTAINRGEDVK